MVSNIATAQTFKSDVKTAKDGSDAVEELLKDLSSMHLARRIEDAARIAMAKHVCRNARLVRSAVEAENSTESA